MTLEFSSGVVQMKHKKIKMKKKKQQKKQNK